MAASDNAPRRALLAGASGLIGRALLAQLLADDRYGHVDVVARRPLAGAETRHPKLTVMSGDMAALVAGGPVADDAYIALGTTIAVAGSEAAFRAVDFDLVVAIARAARAAGTRRLGVVSALGADPRSRVFYNRVKGEMEAALRVLGYDTLAIARPSLLVGDRAALGQPVRRAEVWATRLLGPVMRLVPAGVRPIEASAVAAALRTALGAGEAGVRILTSATMQR
ncbi:MAG TPA: NAD(P)H-binding protein [Caldimonas sp.]|jgi:uncharacterized protein YbjT (DUF2867 family)